MHRSFRSPRIGVIAVVVALAVALIGLAPLGADRSAVAQGDAAVTNSTIRFVHAVPDTPNVDVLLDGQPSVKGLGFGKYTEYATVPPGDHQLQVVPSGQSGAQPLVDQQISLDEGSAYIVTVLGQVGDISAKVNEVNLDALDPGKARVRLIHASPDAGKVDVQSNGGDKLFEGVDFKSDTEYKTIDAGSYQLAFLGDNDAQVATASLEAQPGRVYDLVAVGLVNAQSFQLLQLVTNVSPPCSEVLGVGAQTDACVRVVQAQPDLPTADVAIAGNVVAPGLAFGQASEFVPVPAGEDLDISAAPAGQPASGGGQKATLEAGQAYDVVLYSDSNAATPNPASAGAQFVVAQVDLTPLPENQARVRLIHAASDVGGIDLVIPGGSEDQKLFDNVDKGDSTSYTVVNSGTYPIQVRRNGEEASIFDAQLEAKAGVVYDIVAFGREDAGTFNVLILTVPAQLRSDTATPAASKPGATPEAPPVAPVQQVKATPAASPTS